MANTWQSSTAGAAYAANKYMIDVFNSSSSARYVRIFTLIFLNNGTSGVTGVLNVMQVHSTSASSGGTGLTPVTMDTSNSALDANTISGTNRTTTTVAQLRQLLTSPDEPNVTTLDWDSLGTLLTYAQVWNHGLGDSTIQPFTCRASENRGLTLKSVTQTVGSGDFEALFTDAAS